MFLCLLELPFDVEKKGSRSMGNATKTNQDKMIGLTSRTMCINKLKLSLFHNYIIMYTLIFCVNRGEVGGVADRGTV